MAPPTTTTSPTDAPSPAGAVKGNDIKKAGGVAVHPRTGAVVQKEGWLNKQGNFIRNWRPRWVQLVDGILYYFKEPAHEVEPTNYFLLAGAKAQPYDRHGPTCFELTLANGERRYMTAPSKDERDEWIAAITKATLERTRTSLKPAASETTGSVASLTPSATDAATSPTPTAPIPASSSSSAPSSPSKKRKFKSPDDFTFIKVLGKGNYGKVMLATPKNAPNEFYAVKIFFHIVKERRFPEHRAKFYLAEIVLAVQYLHSKGVVYRDLKLENVLLDEEGHVKITDFGLCKEGIGENITTSTFCGTPEYLAPEILEEENYGKSVDWWACGIVLYEMLVGRPPFGTPESVEKLFQAILHQPIHYPSTLSAPAKSLLQGLLTRDATRRLGSGPGDGEAIMQHAFFADIDWTALAARQIEMPFKPNVQGGADASNFDKEFTQLPVALTPSSSMPDLTGLSVADDGGSVLDKAENAA
ncbi:AGC/AKT protein kinase [Allomyces macrogynus ATCC 38327]|uniref:non-specific serine/threonine protein kinase n=1 Tax=Allomyces macrogynus (strain ATCC 38327) TaxID=578462 RepID=A0A0L0SW31_ALLM3|nr:AGC/AKT protein kinase [Allomyces macrogynus ATCC 38327]|eukprot:KNE66793.1 AGC/AKT protein kinase [Allomyces macrogynus ATCC 38327]